MPKLPTGSGVSRLRVATVGTGTCVPRLERGGPCVLIRTESAVAVVDLGLGALHGLLRVGIEHRDVDALFLTHFHPDHTAELPAFLFAANYDERPRERPLVVLGGAGVARFLEGLGNAYGRWLEPRGYSRRIRELSPGATVTVADLRCRVGAVRHTESSLAFRFEAGGRSVVVSGDTGPCGELSDLARGADLLLLEASLPEGARAEGHLTAGQAGAIGRAAGVGALVLYHLYPSAELADPRTAASATFGGSVEVARDGAWLEV